MNDGLVYVSRQSEALTILELAYNKYGNHSKLMNGGPSWQTFISEGISE